MGQGHSTPHSRTQRPTLVNFYHVCNIIPDAPEHHNRLWCMPPPEDEQMRMLNDEMKAAYARGEVIDLT